MQGFNPDYAVVEFAEDERQREQGRTIAIQVIDNMADSVKSTTEVALN